jgi:hypothetical protein
VFETLSWKLVKETLLIVKLENFVKQ